MKKRSIRPISVLLIIGILICLSIIILGIICIVHFCLSKHFGLWEGVIIVSTSFVVSLFTFLFYSFIRKKVVFDCKSLYVNADVSDKYGVFLRKLQHPVTVLYKDIANVYLIESKRDSLGRPVKNVFVNMLYLVFDCKDGNKEAINVYYYSKAQVAKMIDEIKLRAKANGNNLELNSGKEILKAFNQGCKFSHKN